MTTIIGAVQTINTTGRPDLEFVLASINYELTEWYSADMLGSVEVDYDEGIIGFAFEVNDQAAEAIVFELEGSIGEGESENATWELRYYGVVTE